MGFLYVFLLRGEDAPKWKQFEDVYESWVFFLPWIEMVFSVHFLNRNPYWSVRSSSGNHDCHDLWLGGCGVPQARHGDRPDGCSDSQPILENVGDIADPLVFSFWGSQIKKWVVAVSKFFVVFFVEKVVNCQQFLPPKKRSGSAGNIERKVPWTNSTTQTSI